MRIVVINIIDNDDSSLSIMFIQLTKEIPVSGLNYSNLYQCDTRTANKKLKKW